MSKPMGQLDAWASRRRNLDEQTNEAYFIIFHFVFFFLVGVPKTKVLNFILSSILKLQYIDFKISLKSSNNFSDEYYALKGKIKGSKEHYVKNDVLALKLNLSVFNS